MRRYFLSVLLLAPSPIAGATPPDTPKAVAFTHVSVIDLASGSLRPDQTVIVTANRITAVGGPAEVRVPKDVPVVDAAGKFLIPGLWDMHAHATHDEFRTYFLEHGVTGVRHMYSLNPLFSPRSWRASRSLRLPHASRKNFPRTILSARRRRAASLRRSCTRASKAWTRRRRGSPVAG